MNRRICRKVLDCGDGVREVTALAVAALNIRKLAADTATSTQSGDSEDSVAAVQDARAPIRFALGSWSRCAVEQSWRLPMNLKVGRDSVEPWNSLGATNIRARRSLALPTEIGSWSQCMRKSERRLPMNLKGKASSPVRADGCNHDFL